MNQGKFLAELREHFRISGFNLTLAVKPSEYNSSPGVEKKTDSIFPETNSVILAGFGGNGFWSIFQEFLKENPQFQSKRTNLIDDYSVLKFEQTSKILNQNQIAHKFIYPFGESALDLNFLRLGELAGAGVQSLLGILLHPVYGTWISLRGAILADISLDSYDSPISDFAPCPTCVKPCITACPANTVSESGWDWESCMKFRLEDKTCSNSCASRRACPYGKDEQYTEQQLQYHHKFVLKSAKNYYSHDY